MFANMDRLMMSATDKTLIVFTVSSANQERDLNANQQQLTLEMKNTAWNSALAMLQALSLSTLSHTTGWQSLKAQINRKRSIGSEHTWRN